MADEDDIRIDLKSDVSQGEAARKTLQQINREADDVGRTFSVSTNKLQTFAQTFDDLQYVPEQGLRPILNNLTQISPALGIAAIAVSVLMSHWEEPAGLFGKGFAKSQADECEAFAAGAGGVDKTPLALFVARSRSPFDNPIVFLSSHLVKTTQNGIWGLFLSR